MQGKNRSSGSAHSKEPVSLFGLNGRFFAPACLQKGAARRGCQDGPQAPAKRLGLDSPEHGAMLTANRAFKVQAPGFSASLPAGVTVLSGGSKSCRSMAGNRDGANSGQSTKTCHFALVSKHGIYRGAGVKETRHGSKTCRGQLRTPQPDRQASASTNQPPKLRQS